LAPPGSEAQAALAAIRERLFVGYYAGGEQLAKQTLQPPKRNFGTHLTYSYTISKPMRGKGRVP